MHMIISILAGICGRFLDKLQNSSFLGSFFPHNAKKLGWFHRWCIDKSHAFPDLIYSKYQLHELKFLF